MKTVYELITSLFNKAEMANEEVKNLQVNAYKVIVNGNTVSIETLCINQYGTIHRTNDVRTIAPSKKQLTKLQRRGELFYIYED